MSSQVSPRTKKTASPPAGPEHDGRKKSDKMPPGSKTNGPVSLTENRKPSWTWMAAAAGSALVALAYHTGCF